MSKALVVVESPAKAKTIEKFLGKNYMVKASMGHLRDLPKSQFGVDIENNFSPKYINIRGKGDLIKSLKDAAKNADTVYLATDPDREGEAIAWHLAHILNLSEHTTCRIEFNEITKPAIQQAIKKPRPINLPRVYAQQTRRILDRIVGYKLSPLLWRKVRKGLSAGRVQSVTVRLICDREKEIQAFVPEEYWTITAKLKEKSTAKAFVAELFMVGSEKLNVNNQSQAETIVSELTHAEYVVSDVKKRERKRNPYPPFTTSSLQQEAARKLGFTSRKTMMVAQQLYEGLDIGRAGQVGLITYMRTDSTRIAETAQQEARAYIENKFGVSYLPAKAPVYANKKSQDAHEAVRPTTLELLPEAIGKSLTKDQLKLYTLIWERFIASQMTPAVYDTLTIEITAGNYRLKATGSQLKFPGFLAAFSGTIGKGKELEQNSDSDLDTETTLPELKTGQVLQLAKLEPKQHFTEPPPRYTEASLVKVLEEKGIGRPSTYAPTIETIVVRGYVERVEKKFHPTDLGIVVLDLLKQYFERIIDVEFTAGMEDKLDAIAEGDASWLGVLEEFYDPFAKDLSFAEEAIGQVELPVEVSDIPCENCGKMMIIKQGRYGNFLACPGFPACRNTKPILKDIGVKCPKCGGAVVERKTKRRRIFYGCEKYPECDFTTWDLPLNDNCPICGTYMVRHKYKNGGFAAVCSNESCPSRQTSENKETTKKAEGKAAKPTSSKASANRRKKSG
ncbi:DNA topoisomerase 1 [uncultured Sporomusa sp.]|uniref:DNA topoisomerase 1 n=1 Tax=uncultured Sporomusa sp. TaxID=307249 RepID=A0A212LSL7_9FIRM|nr:type I DNA topoisomerase [uncultured Sporomusa sp.]SCM80476.1 DNA topoisomerase 1 [uncultured Sporomusa sp.]